MWATIRCFAFGVSIGAFCGIGLAQQTRKGTVPLTAIIEAVEKTRVAIRPRLSYQVIREYRLFGANDSRTDANVIAEVDFKSPAHKEYRIRSSTGSNRGVQVVRRILQHEVEAASDTNQAHTALSRDNYDFTYFGEAVLDGQSCYLLGLKPRRRETELISGRVWVDKQTFLARQVEGEATRTPSWWLKSIHIKLTFAAVQGTWIQTGMEAVADVRMLGPHTLRSRILDYRGANEVALTGIETRSADRQ
jgi:hypothetical protein